MDQDFLKERMGQLGITFTELAKEVANVRKDLYQETLSYQNIRSSVRKAVERPSASLVKNIAAIVIAMGGEWFVVWSGEKVMVDQEFLVSRMEELQIDYTELSSIVVNVRKDLYQELMRRQNLRSNIKKAVESPSTSFVKKVESIVIAMGGQWFVEWPVEKIVVETKIKQISKNKKRPRNGGVN